MLRVFFTANLQRHIACPPRDVPGRTVAEALAAVFADNPPLRGYILDDQGGVRKHIAIFLNGEPIHDRHHLSDPVPDSAELHVMQALSGGCGKEGS